ncbi:DUF2243 domain-containing protein [Macrococcus equipercicus]|uniref:DUF2243 domain-containing protein n=1 Tax=Macrococcus equipercicus TaxID=69967 RepID=A0A9Q9BQN7_9STAP|nr:DUF2243 domain-containing protein [Macrococcus equipercicus]KAA1039577.1 DUF2243 domain-containing protein [Macrococcus equipercicus]UTH13906.1 DUF2243 domain-containing protein [Macrococcus equipercicus]
MNQLSSEHTASAYTKQSRWSGFLFGLGLVAFLDETVFHQLLHWHHFYDKSTETIGIVSDGLLNSGAGFVLIFGLFLLADFRRRHLMDWKFWIGHVLMGMGTFQLFDGTINHKLFGIHQIRYVDNLIVYDIGWHIVALLLLIGGFMLARHAEKQGTK